MCYMKLHLVALRQGHAGLLESHRVFYLPLRFVREVQHQVIHIRYLQQQSPTVYKLLHLSLARKNCVRLVCV